MDKLEDLYSQAEEAEAVLKSRLTEQEQGALRGIYRSMSKQVLWKKLLDQIVPAVLESVEELFEPLGQELCKYESPWHGLSSDDFDLFDNEDEKAQPRKHLITLWMAKKLLGGMKTRINQAIDGIQILSPEDELHLVDVALAPEGLEAQIAAEERGEDEVRFKKPQLCNVKKPEVVATVDIGPQGGCIDGGRHCRTLTRWKRLNGEMFSETICKDCRKTVEKVACKGRKADPKKCVHPSAYWVEGQEGKAAKCTACNEPVKEPETYRWVQSGLEPFNDDPTQDEVITLCSDY